MLVLVVGGREWTVTFRASRADRKDKNGGEKKKKREIGGVSYCSQEKIPRSSL